jgi:hypothetical protein
VSFERQNVSYLLDLVFIQLPNILHLETMSRAGTSITYLIG